MKKIFFVVFFFVSCAAAKDVIYELDDAEYYRMPERTVVARSDRCVRGEYCTAQAALVSDQPSQLLDMIRAYSAHSKHYNYTDIVRGVCVTDACAGFLGDARAPALRAALEACLNDSLSREYGLKAKVYDHFCYQKELKYDLGYADLILAVVMSTILVFNVAGSLYDLYFRDGIKPGNNILMSFSIVDNWRRLVAAPSDDPRDAQLRILNGLRAITSIIIILGHVDQFFWTYIGNPLYIEKNLRQFGTKFALQGHIYMQTFFIMSGFLLVYTQEKKAEKQKFTWSIMLKSIFNRWLRLSPASLVVLMCTMSLYKFIDKGPFWWFAAGREISYCHKYWPSHFFNLNNIIGSVYCNLEKWSVATDMQLHVIGLVVLLLAGSLRARTRLLAALFLLGLVWPAYHIYTKDLKATLTLDPHTVILLFERHGEFYYLYSHPIANLPSFVLGMAAGHLLYRLQKKNLIGGDYTKYRYAYWLLPVLQYAPNLADSALYTPEAPRAALLTRVLIGTITKPLYALCIILLIIGAAYKVEDVYRGILEWRGWVYWARISYCLYIVHIRFLRYFTSTEETLIQYSELYLVHTLFGILALSAAAALALHLTVEAPFIRLASIFTESSTRIKLDENTTNSTNGKSIETSHKKTKSSLDDTSVQAFRNLKEE